MERTLSKNESRVILDLEWRGQKTVRAADVRSLLGCSDGYGRFIAHQLVRKGWLERLRPGLFQLIPADRGREGVADLNPLAAGAVLVEPYFFSFGTACTHHGLTEQVFTEVYIACQQRRHAESIRGTRYVYVNVRPDRFFGFADVSALGETVKMAILERALVDALDRPAYAGGLGEVSRMVARAATRISWDGLFEVLGRWEESACAQRLGYLLDLHQVDLPRDRRSALASLVRSTSRVHLGPRHKWGTAGRLASPWNIIENVPREALIEKGERPKRQYRFREPELPEDRGGRG